MKVWIDKEDLQILRNARDFGRTRQVEVSSFRRYKDENKEVEVELNEINDASLIPEESLTKLWDNEHDEIWNDWKNEIDERKSK